MARGTRCCSGSRRRLRPRRADQGSSDSFLTTQSSSGMPPVSTIAVFIDPAALSARRPQGEGRAHRAVAIGGEERDQPRRRHIQPQRDLRPGTRLAGLGRGFGGQPREGGVLRDDLLICRHRHGRGGDGREDAAHRGLDLLPEQVAFAEQPGHGGCTQMRGLALGVARRQQRADQHVEPLALARGHAFERGPERQFQREDPALAVDRQDPRAPLRQGDGRRRLCRLRRLCGVLSAHAAPLARPC